MVRQVRVLRGGRLYCRRSYLAPSALRPGSFLDGPSPRHEPVGHRQFSEVRCRTAMVPERSPGAGDGAFVARTSRGSRGRRSTEETPDKGTQLIEISAEILD